MLRKVRVISALPSVFAALKIAAPAAFLGAILAEYLGSGGDGTLGGALIAAQTQSDAPLLWYLALVSGAISGVGYLVVGLVARLVAPGPTEPARRACDDRRGPGRPGGVLAGGGGSRRARSRARCCAGPRSAALTVAIAFVVLMALWQVLLAVFDVSAFVGKSPLDVWQYLFAEPPARGVRPPSLSAEQARAAASARWAPRWSTRRSGSARACCGHRGGGRVRAVPAVRVRVHADRDAAALGAAGRDGAAAAAGVRPGQAGDRVIAASWCCSPRW